MRTVQGSVQDPIYSEDPVGDSSICALLVFPVQSDLASVPWLGSGEALAGLGAGGAEVS